MKLFVEGVGRSDGVYQNVLMFLPVSILSCQNDFQSINVTFTRSSGHSFHIVIIIYKTVEKLQN